MYQFLSTSASNISASNECPPGYTEGPDCGCYILTDRVHQVWRNFQWSKYMNYNLFSLVWCCLWVWEPRCHNGARLGHDRKCGGIWSFWVRGEKKKHWKKRIKCYQVIFLVLLDRCQVLLEKLHLLWRLSAHGPFNRGSSPEGGGKPPCRSDEQERLWLREETEAQGVPGSLPQGTDKQLWAFHMNESNFQSTNSFSVKKMLLKFPYS